MRCADASRQLQLYIDSRLTLAQMRVLEAHIATCAACQREFWVLEEVSTSFRTLTTVAEPEDLTTRILQQVAITPQQQRRKSLFSRKKERVYSLLRPSLPEVIAVVLLATITTLGILWQQPAIRYSIATFHWA